MGTIAAPMSQGYYENYVELEALPLVMVKGRHSLSVELLYYGC